LQRTLKSEMNQPVVLRVQANQLLLTYKGLLLFGILIILQFVFFYLYDHVLIDDSLYFDFLGDKLSYERINHIIQKKKDLKWLSYTLMPLFTLLKCFAVSTCLYTGALLDRSENRFADFFKVSLLAEFIWLFPTLVKIIWFGFIHRSYGLDDLMYFSPASLLAVFDRHTLDAWLIYPLRIANLFEVIYWLSLAFLLMPILKKRFSQSLNFVSYTYGIALFIWALFIMFIKLSMS
jgi:hypothetical protein